jgi:hypothetical protein
MEYITLVDCSELLKADHLKELYQSKLKHLTATLGYFDRLQANARVTLHCQEKGYQLRTRIEIETKDDEFKKVLSEATKSFNSTLETL